MKKPSLERVNELLAYDPKTGIFTRKVKSKSWNASGRKYGAIGAGRINEFGYVMIPVDGLTYNAGSLAWFITHGDWPLRIRYKNGDKTDNRVENIKLNVKDPSSRIVRPTQARLKDVVEYFPETGEFVWKQHPTTRLIGTRAGKVGGLGYRSIGIDYKRYAEHNLAWLYMMGYWPDESAEVEGGQIDHINRVRNDNRWGNLRLVSRSENNINKGLNYANTTGCTGVYRRRRGFSAGLTFENTWYPLGLYKTVAEARVARLLAEIENFDRCISWNEETDAVLPAVGDFKVHLERNTTSMSPYKDLEVDSLTAYNHHGVPFFVKSVETITCLIAAAGEDGYPAAVGRDAVKELYDA